MDSVTVGSTTVNASDGRFGFVASREDCLLPGCVPRGLSSAPSELASAQRVRSLSLASRATTNYARARADKSVATSGSDETAQVVVVVVGITSSPPLTSQ